MPSVGCKPQAEGAWRGWNALVGDVLGYRCVDDSEGTTHDSAATYFNLPRAGPVFVGNGRVSFPFFLQYAGGLPTRVTVNVGARRGSVTHPELQVGFLRGASVAFSGATIDPGADWFVDSFQFVVDPITGTAWRPQDLAKTEVCVQSLPAAGAGSNDITLISASVDYLEPFNMDPGDPGAQGLT